MLHWRKRIDGWRVVLARKGAKVSILALVRSVASGPVPADVWRDRIKVCLRCPVFDREFKACHKELSDGRVIGCSCFTPFLALTAIPYTKSGGCWAREITVHEGWPAYLYSSGWAKVRAVLRFIRG